jgi:small-conductance mechanosensitive channel
MKTEEPMTSRTALSTSSLIFSYWPRVSPLGQYEKIKEEVDRAVLEFQFI